VAPGKGWEKKPVPKATAAPPPKPVAPPAPAKPSFDGPFPPAPFEPMFERTAKPEDGTWVPMADGAESGTPVMARADIHPHKIKKWVTVTAIAFDLQATELHLVAGTEEPMSNAVPAERRMALVPEDVYPGLLAVFNGGFKARHGNFGMMLDGDEYVPPIDDACAVALFKDGSIRIATWSELAPHVEQMRAWRQTPPCLVEDGVVNERLPSEFRTRKWGAAQGGKRDIRRSAIGFDASGRSLVYVFADWVTASDLAAALKQMGLKSAAQLDINWSYTRFFLFERRADGVPQIRETLIPKLKFNRARYIEKKSYRDFFYVTKRR